MGKLDSETNHLLLHHLQHFFVAYLGRAKLQKFNVSTSNVAFFRLYATVFSFNLKGPEYVRERIVIALHEQPYHASLDTCMSNIG
ncbi:hypothetical protein GCM10023213_41470 [Prosthecobacter algae]|uniref:Uncharacterized protein n=1 Tax=Prosthecobacter algae TaxID=1144682 RepID=A0ABP9PMB2_9BACT